VTLVGTVQQNLVITQEGEPSVTVDDLDVGQFIYLMLNDTKIRNVIDTITSKGVLILGRFSNPQRKSVLDGLRERLRNFDLLPIVFDFDTLTDKDYTETVQTLVQLHRAAQYVSRHLLQPSVQQRGLSEHTTCSQSRCALIASLKPHQGQAN
jgi:hypothetical protein